VTAGRLRSLDLWLDPYPTFAALRQEAPVHQFDERAFMVSTWHLVAEAANRTEDFSNHFRYSLFTDSDGALRAMETGGAGPDVFAGADPPLHTAHRRIFLGEFSQRNIDLLEPYVAGLTDDLLDEMLDGERCDAADQLCAPLPTRVIAERVIGFREPDLARLRCWIADGSRLAGGLLTLEELAARHGDIADMPAWTAAQLHDAQSTPHPAGLLGATAAAVRDGSLTPDEAVFNLMVLVGAGAETTTSLIGIAISLLAHHEHLQAELRRAPAKVPAFIEEVLRFESPFRYHPRTVARACELGGALLPSGALVQLLWASANRDPSVFERPDDVVLDRPNAHLHFGFGRGIHHCVGAHLARLEARVVVERLLARTKAFALEDGRPEQWSHGIWIHRHDALPLVIEPA